MNRFNGNMMPLLEGIHTLDAWMEKESRLRERWLQLLGEPPGPVDYKPSAAANSGGFRVVSEHDEEDHTRLKIVYHSPEGDPIQAYLLLPHGKPVEGGYPAVLALHPTTENGKDDVCLPSGRENRRYGLELVQHGFAVLAPDSITFGDRVYAGEAPFQTAPFYRQHPAWTAVGKMLSDHITAVDVLSSLPQVNSHRIGVIGHSLGGYNGWFLAGMDKRIKAVVSSCGFTMFRGDPEPNRWGQREWFSHIPSITDSLSNGDLPFEWHEIAALAAPVPMLMWCGMRDPIFPNWREIASGLGELDGLYDFLGASSAFECWIGHEGHDFPPDIRQRAYAFLEKKLAE
ncbi:dipeptidyl aminopeptidase [Paenibacillus sp. LC231]|uniref:alpha/beta hydrolase family protein n=1 Tax=Paenibacillus sp. LC231 TaxID=1120679 RepID=UPI0008DE69D1|nr:alpha/beta fold hydrolase [Paenibacillus sp. LC231]OIB03861.1 dipeptidyl aminopeptidase [Paenibacillus sp. LC231]